MIDSENVDDAAVLEVQQHFDTSHLARPNMG